MCGVWQGSPGRDLWRCRCHLGDLLRSQREAGRGQRIHLRHFCQQESKGLVDVGAVEEIRVTPGGDRNTR